jgi:hypothetical protein
MLHNRFDEGQTGSTHRVDHRGRPRFRCRGLLYRAAEPIFLVSLFMEKVT